MYNVQCTMYDVQCVDALKWLTVFQSDSIEYFRDDI